jgi:tetratricopeptide (TPR) repeat protein
MNDWMDAELRAELAHRLYEEGRLAEAAAELRAAIDINPANASWHFNLAVTFDAMEDYDRACEAYRAVLRFDPGDVEALNGLGVNLTRRGRHAEALAQFEAAERIDPTFEPSYCNRIVTYAELGDAANAELMFYLARQVKDACPHCCYNLGGVYFARGRHDRAIACWRQTLRLDPDHPDANLRLAEAYWAAGDLDRAREHYLIELRQAPDDHETRLDYGELLMEMSRADEAESAFRRVLICHPHSASACFCLAELSLRRGRLYEAEKFCRRAIKFDPDYPGVHLKLGQVLLRRRRTAEAVRHLRAELDCCGDDEETLQALGPLLLDAAQPRFANDALRRLVSMRPDDARAQHNLAVSFFMLDHYDEGIRHCRKALKLKPEYALALYNLALAHLEKGNVRRAQRYLSRAVVAAPGNAQVRGLVQRLRARGLWSRIRRALPFGVADKGLGS